MITNEHLHPTLEPLQVPDVQPLTQGIVADVNSPTRRDCEILKHYRLATGDPVIIQSADLVILAISEESIRTPPECTAGEGPSLINGGQPYRNLAAETVIRLIVCISDKQPKSVVVESFTSERRWLFL